MDHWQSIFEKTRWLGTVPADRFHLISRTYRAGEMLTDHPDGHRSVGIIVEGTVEVWTFSGDGNGVLLNVLHAGDCFGVCNLLTGEMLQTSLCCGNAATVLFLRKEEVEKALREDGALAFRYAAFCNEKIQFLLRRIALLTGQTTRARLIAYLLLHMSDEGKVILQGTRTALAASLSMSRAALYRELGVLEKAGLIELPGDAIVVRSREGLHQLL